MRLSRSKYVVIGAGLSGITAAHHLWKRGETDFVVLESRDRIGGRILTENSIDWGATWFQPHHQRVIDMLDKLGVEKFYQYNAGKSILLYNTMPPEHYFESNSQASPAYRIAGGSKAIIEALAQPFLDSIKTETVVTAIDGQGDEMYVSTGQETFSAQKVIVTVPPLIATRITFSPALPDALTNTMKNTHTWMSNAIKIGITFEKPFWRDKDLSGTVIGQVGPVVELYDHTDYKKEHYALMGFINEGMRDVSANERKTRIIDYLAKYLGEEVRGYLSYHEKDWAKDQHTACETVKSIYMSPAYGNPLFDNFYMNGRLLFSGAETSSVYGGYMDGAIASGIRAAVKVVYFHHN